jgi:hypothetical protein
VLVTDGRYTTQAKAETAGVKVLIAPKSAAVAACEWIAEAGLKRCGFDEGNTSVAALKQMQAALPGKLRRNMFQPLGPLVSTLRWVKDQDEIAKMRAAATLGVRVLWLRAACVLGSGLLAGVGGATLSVGILGQFDTRMPAGQGFMALAAVVFGRWNFLGAAGAAFFFAAGDAVERQLSFSLHAADLRLEGVFLALPYALTLLVLALGIGRTRAPAADGVPYDPEGH